MNEITVKHLYTVEKYITFHVYIMSGDFSGCSNFCTSEEMLQSAVEALDMLHERLYGEYTLTDYDSDDYILFQFQKYGHLKISGQVGGSQSDQFLKFSLYSDQTFLRRLITELRYILQKSKAEAEP